MGTCYILVGKCHFRQKCLQCVVFILDDFYRVCGIERWPIFVCFLVVCSVLCGLVTVFFDVYMYDSYRYVVLFLCITFFHYNVKILH
jgi:hypothetical protein